NLDRGDGGTGRDDIDALVRRAAPRLPGLLPAHARFPSPPGAAPARHLRRVAVRGAPSPAGRGVASHLPSGPESPSPTRGPPQPARQEHTRICVRLRTSSDSSPPPNRG